MFFVFNRETLQLEGSFNKVSDDHMQDGFLVLPGSDQQGFYTVLDRAKVSQLEVALMYRNAGDIDGAVSHYRDTLISNLFHLLVSGRALTRHTVQLFSGAAQAGTAPDRPVANTVAPTRTPSAPRSGSRVTIFEVADRIWNDAGAPKELSTVLQLRKTIMAELEAQHGVKKTTSSTALGEWQKLRLNN